jgi:LytS/YehU family sensor histidine kinase
MGLAVTVQAHDRERARQEHEARLALAAQQSELSAIKAQLQPHFLLNALNSAVALLDDSPDEARAMLIRLGSLLQSIFDRLEQPSVPLARELDTVRDYLDVERIRFGDRLRYAIDAAPGAADVAVPPFILQPLVENAIRHGIEPLARPGTVHVGARRNGSVLHVEITDTGNGFADGTAPRGGRGLDLTARRLSTLYGARAALDFRSGPGGFTAHLQLPIDDRP